MRWWLLLAVVSVACDSSPTGTDAADTVFDLLYESVVSSSVLLQPIEGGQPIVPVNGVDVGFEPAASADGAWFVYRFNDENAAGDIVVVDRASGDATPLTNDDAFDEQPAISRDGQHIAFVSDRDGFADIHVMKRDGTGRKRLTDDPEPGIWVDRAPAWSPDGRRIAFASNRDGVLQIWIMNSDGSNAHRLTESDASEDDPAWSPDGTRIAFLEVSDVGSELVVVNVDGSGRVALPKPTNGVSRMPEWSPDGKLIAFAFSPTGSAFSQLYTVRPDGTELTPRNYDAQNRGARNPTWIRRR